MTPTISEVIYLNCSLQYPYTHLLNKKKSLKKELLLQQELRDIRIAVLSGSTIGEIPAVLEVFLLALGLRPLFWVGAYNRWYEDAMFENNKLTAFQPDIIYIHTTVRNSDDILFERLQEVWENLQANYHCVIIQNNFEMPCQSYLDNHERTTRLNRQMQAYAKSNSDFYINDIAYISAYYGLNKWFDETCWYCYKYAMDVNAIPMLAHGIAKLICSIYSRNQKCLVLDLDNTLWGGVVGEVGPMGIELGMDSPMGEAYTAFQKYVKQLHDIGVILAVCSKNNETTAKSAFNNPNMILKQDDFAVFCANWENKADNILYIAQTLNILPDAIVFIDDNPVERDLVRMALPDVKVPEVTHVTDFIRTIDQAGYFNVTSVSADDLRRNEYYRADSLRSEAQKTCASYRDYLLSLSMRAELAPFSDAVYERVSQLINKTNQFNLTAKRLTVREVEEAAGSDSCMTAYATLEDKFGANGIVSVLIGKVIENCLHIHVWVMSCRVFQRDLELAMFDYIVSLCRAAGLVKISGYYRKTGKNAYVAHLYEELGFVKCEEGVWAYVIPKEYINKNSVIQVNR